MSSKRQRGEGSSSKSKSTAYDNQKFVSEDAYARFLKLIKKTIVPERGLRPDENQDGEVAVMIAERDWFALTEQPEPAVIAVVKEFYANAKEHDHYSVHVRGKDVSFSARSINRYYQLPPPEIDEYTQYLSAGPDYDLIVKKLCRPGTTWDIKEKDAMEFKKSALGRYGIAWYSFISANLMPSTHVTEVSKERAVLLYCVVQGMKINVGRVINRSMVRALELGTRGGLPHPSLICGLCRQAGVRWGDDEPVIKPKPQIDHKLITRYIVWPGAESDPRGMGFVEPQTDDENLLIAPTTAAPSSSSDGITLQGLSDQMRRLKHRMEVYDRQMDSKSYRLAKRQGEMHKYNVQFNTALVQMLTAMHPTPAHVQFPQPPHLSTYPPSDLDEDEEDESSEAAAESDEDSD